MLGYESHQLLCGGNIMKWTYNKKLLVALLVGGAGWYFFRSWPPAIFGFCVSWLILPNPK